jgi:hypothetical protein
MTEISLYGVHLWNSTGAAVKVRALVMPRLLRHPMHLKYSLVDDAFIEAHVVTVRVE